MKRFGFLLGAILLALYSLAPLLWQLITSLTPDAQLTQIPPLLPTHLTWAHYAAVFSGRPFWHILLNSTVVAGATTLLALAVGSLAAFALTYLQVRRRFLILGAVLATSMFPPIATVSPLYIIINALGMRDTLAALILTYTTFAVPLAVWLLTHFFAQASPEIYRAARVDGCGLLRAFVRVVLPISAPGLVATGLLVFIYAWNEFLYALTFTATAASRTVPVEIAMFPGVHQVPWGDIAAATMVVVVPLLVLALIFQRRIVEGLTAGAVKE